MRESLKSKKGTIGLKRCCKIWRKGWPIGKLHFTVLVHSRTWRGRTLSLPAESAVALGLVPVGAGLGACPRDRSAAARNCSRDLEQGSLHCNQCQGTTGHL